jgi:hypothetical protein
MCYDAVAFLESLFQPRSSDAAASGWPASTAPAPALSLTPHLPPEWHLAWDERAAIMEYDGGLSRERAEAKALTDILSAMQRAGQNPLS